MNKIYCSTGVMVGRINNNDYTLITRHFPKLVEKGLIYGGEFMFAHSFYDKLDYIYDEITKSNIKFDIIHFDKEIGIMLSECNDEISLKALDLFKINCDFAKRIEAKKCVFHLWGGAKSDSNIKYNISYLSRLIDIAKVYNLELLIENIPCTVNSGLQIWRMLYSYLPNIGFIFDTRFGAFHDEIQEIFNEPIWNHIKHIHISDYSSFPRDFSKIRPILHPGEGVVNFKYVFSKLKEIGYTGTFTLESPVFNENGPDICKLEKTLKYINDNISSHD